MASQLSAQVTASAPRIRVGPNVVVSRDLEMPHYEVHLAAASWDPNVLIGGGIAVPPGGLDHQSAVYISTDGGASWASRLMPGTYGDPQVAVGITSGRLLFVALNVESDGATFVSTSDDRGGTWRAPVKLPYSDRPQIAVDQTNGRFRGSAYLTGTGGCGPKSMTYVLCMWRSPDQGRTWKAPAAFEVSDGTIGYGVGVPLVLSDGTLVVTYRSWYNDTTKGRQRAWYVRTSRDGGATFSRRRLVHAQLNAQIGRTIRYPTAGAELIEGWAVDTSARHRNRIYFAHADDAVVPGRVFVRFSDDRGMTWSPPAVVDPGAPAETEQQMPTLAVNKDGVVGVWWFDSRHAREVSRPGDSFHDTYFAASLDGGATFLPTVRVSTESSVPNASKGVWKIGTDAREDTSRTAIPAVVWKGLGVWYGGDYAGLAADARGVFWPLWPDARRGFQHVYTAAVVVGQGGDDAPALTKVDTIERSRYEVVYDPLRYLDSAGIVEVSLLVRNRSKVPWYGPLTLTATLMPWPSPEADWQVAELVPDSGAPGDTGSHRSQQVRLESLVPGVVYPGQGTARAVFRLRRRADAKPDHRLDSGLIPIRFVLTGVSGEHRAV